MKRQSKAPPARRTAGATAPPERRTAGAVPQENVAAPPTNRGASDTKIEALIDWFSFTLKTFENPYQAVEVLGFDDDQFTKMDHGGMGYKDSLRCGNIVIYYNGNPGMGVHVSLSGQGCRAFEALYKFKDECWYNLLERVDYHQGNVTRVDLAIDDRMGAINFDRIRESVDSGYLRTRYKISDEMRRTGINEGGLLGRTFYFGSATSDTRIRIYDKALEKGFPDLVWNRIELQARAERAAKLARELLGNPGQIGQVAAGVLRYYLDFVEPSGKDTNKSRWGLSDWWSAMVQEVQKIGLTLQAPERTLQKVKNWLSRQVATSLALVHKAIGIEFLGDLLEEGEKKLKPFHLALIPRAA